MTRADLPAATQAVQAAHAAVEYAAAHPRTAGCTLVMLTAPREDDLRHHAAILGLHGADVVQFREPDLDNALTAIAVAHPAAERRLKRLPLMLGGR